MISKRTAYGMTSRVPVHVELLKGLRRVSSLMAMQALYPVRDSAQLVEFQRRGGHSAAEKMVKPSDGWCKPAYRTSE